MARTIGITIGEPLGIGPELVVRTLSAAKSKTIPKSVRFRLYGSESLLEATAKKLKIKPFWSKDSDDRVLLVPCGPEPEKGIFRSEDTASRALATIAALNKASDEIMSADISALVTAPIDKAVVRTLIPKFTGHTGYLGERANAGKTFMLLDNTEIRVVLLTEHIPLREISHAVTHLSVEEAIQISTDSFKKLTGKKNLRVALVGLNPHAGEIVDRPEEELVMRPIIERMKNATLHLEGPFPADSFFSQARKGGWDFIISAYHDQGLIPVKYLGLDKVVNITLGLPYLRVSPGHGTAYDIAGKGIADLGSFTRALEIAISGNLKQRK